MSRGVRGIQGTAKVSQDSHAVEVISHFCPQCFLTDLTFQHSYLSLCQCQKVPMFHYLQFGGGATAVKIVHANTLIYVLLILAIFGSYHSHCQKVKICSVNKLLARCQVFTELFDYKPIIAPSASRSCQFIYTVKTSELSRLLLFGVQPLLRRGFFPQD